MDNIRNIEKEPEIIRSDVLAPIKSLKEHKSSEADKICGELLQNLGDNGVVILQNCAIKSGKQKSGLKTGRPPFLFQFIKKAPPLSATTTANVVAKAKLGLDSPNLTHQQISTPNNPTAS